MSASEREEAIKNATVNGTFYAGAYAANLEVAEKERRARAAQKDDPYEGMEDWYENQDRINAEMMDEIPELQAWAKKEKAIKAQKNAELDSATRSYMAMGAAVESGKFSKEDYNKAQEEAQQEKPSLKQKIAKWLFGWMEPVAEYFQKRIDGSSVGGDESVENIKEDVGARPSDILPVPDYGYPCVDFWLNIEGVSSDHVYTTIKDAPSIGIDDATFERAKTIYLGSAPKEIAPDTFVSSYPVEIDGDMVYTMVSQDGDVARFSLVTKSPSGGWNGWDKVPNSEMEVTIDENLCVRESDAQTFINENETLHPPEQP